ncbi:BppU family phage baseplate upper protein [Enterococcus sp. JM9B]|uniref:BppU family phage baseplate upper protein n=1 Tax=Enterococcus sp. JM9B TaxID=1857216 RepID=UPI001374BCDC|nr:BppU family phage baseplate upper protein [Enterococcus sp. JM9B]KAF1303660.1 hypothetical protein BAU16_03595 [Enterococcus sp. JM9B]
MNEDNKIFKTNEISIEISPVKNTVDSQRAQYYSYDENSGLQRIRILKDGQPLGLSEGSQVRLSAVKLSGSKQMMIYTPEIEDRVNGIVTFVIPKEFLGYSGQIRCTLYIDFSSDQTLHAGYFYINMGISDIDANLPEFSDSYWQRWADFESEATTKMQELEAALDGEAQRLNEYADEKMLEMDSYTTEVQSAGNTAAESIDNEIQRLSEYGNQKISQMDGYTAEVQSAGSLAIESIDAESARVGAHADQKITEYDQKFQQTEQNIATLDQNLTELRNDMKLSEAWAWNKEGTDRFTRKYPGENLVTLASLGRHPSASLSNVTFKTGKININSDGRNSIGFYTAGRQYQLSTRYSMKFKMVVNSGSVTSIGGHSTYTYLIHDISINGVSQSINWISGIGYNFENNKEYTVSLVFTTRDTEAMYTEASAGIYIQPNRMGYGAAFDVDISELKIEGDPATIYTTAPSDDPLNAYPQYRGLALLPSDLPSDYVWEESAERIKQLAQQETDKLNGEVADIQNWIAQQGGTA